MPDKGNFEIGIYGQRHLQFLQQNHRITYVNLLTSGNLNWYLAEIDKQAQERFSQIVDKMKQKWQITEQLKAETPLEWVKKMNCVRQQADGIIHNELIFK